MPRFRMVDLADSILASVLSPGDFAIDATVGNGRDTLWLAQRVGPLGRVLGLDLQEEALRRTRERLVESGCESRVLLVKCGHERLDAILSELGPEARPRVVMFNLGYLPGGDRSFVTRAETSLAAVSDALRRVAAGGLVTVIIYPGHPEGKLESDLVLGWAASVGDAQASIMRCEVISKTNAPAPFLLVLEPSRRSV